MSFDADATVELFQRAARALLDCPHRRGSAVRLPARGRLLATGDLHDNPLHLDKVQRLSRLEESPDHHVVLHELIHGERLINGMDFSHRILAKVAQLVLDHPGQAHPLLANHELSQLTGRGVSKGAGNSLKLFNNALEYAFGEDSEEVGDAINGFLAAMPLALLSERGVCCAHSLPDARKMRRFDADVFDRPLESLDYEPPDGAAYLMTWGRAHSLEQVEQLAAAWDVSLFVLGHQHVETGIEARGRRVVVLNTDHERATVLPLDLAAVPRADEALMHAVPLASLE